MASSELTEALHDPIKAGRLDYLQDQYDATMSLEEVARQAALHGQPRILKWCYDQGWKAKSPSFNDKFFLMAVDGASPAIFQVLLDHGWDLNAHESSCGDALACTVIFRGERAYEFAQWLLEHGHRATPHEGCHMAKTTISSTVYGDQASNRMLKLLLRHGIDVKGSGAAIGAAENGNPEALTLLLDYGIDIEDREMDWYPFDEDKDEPEESQGTALYRACRQGHLECVRLLLDRGADAQAKDDGGTSCLAIAKERGHEQVVKLLQEKGVTG